MIDKPIIGHILFTGVDGLHRPLINGVKVSTVNLSAEKRENFGKSAARKLRSSGKIPASIYRDGSASTLVSIDPAKLTYEFEKTGNPNTLVNLDIDGVGQKLCLVKQVQRHPVSGNLQHVDFYNVKPDEDIVVEVPVSTSGKAVGTTLGGNLRIIRRYLNVRSKPNNIPATVSVDVTNLDVGKFIRASEVVSPTNSTIEFEADFNVVTVIGKKGI